MSGLEIFGAVATAISLVQKATKSLDRAKKHGKTLKALRRTWIHLTELQDDVDDYRDRDLLTEIGELVEEATQLIQENRTGMRQAMAFFWDTSLDADIQRINMASLSIDATLRRRIDNDRRGSVLEHLSRPPDTPNPPLPPTLSRECTLDVPCILYLRDANKVLVRDPISLEKLSIIERNSISRFRTLQYETSDHAVVVTHEVPYGTIPCTPNKMDATEVSFLDNHIVTVETQNEFTVFVLDPTYKFESTSDCETFMNVSRERTLKATFLPKRITKSAGSMTKSFFSRLISQDEILARRKVVQIWERVEENTHVVVTLTFHDSTKKRLTQWPMDSFAPYTLLTNGNKGVELSRIDHNEQFVFLFESDIEASRFAGALTRRRRSSTATSNPRPSTHRIPRRPVANSARTVTPAVEEDSD